jgi:hypothetical protein
LRSNVNNDEILVKHYKKNLPQSITISSRIFDGNTIKLIDNLIKNLDRLIITNSKVKNTRALIRCESPHIIQSVLSIVKPKLSMISISPNTPYFLNSYLKNNTLSNNKEIQKFHYDELNKK